MVSQTLNAEGMIAGPECAGSKDCIIDNLS